MQCHKVRNILITDGLDGEWSETQRRRVEAHLAQCPECGAFARELQGAAAEPFMDMPRQDVPSDLLADIHRDLRVRVQARRSVFKNLIEYWWQTVSARPALAFVPAAVVGLIVLLSVFQPPRVATQVALQDLSEDSYLMYLASYAEDGNGSDGYGTVIEEVFL